MAPRRGGLPGAKTALAIAVACATFAVGGHADDSRLSDQERPEAQLERSSARLAATLALSKLEVSLAASAPGSECLYDEMTANPKQYVNKDDAETQLKAFYERRVSADFAREAEKMLERLAGEKGIDGMFGGGFGSVTNAPRRHVEAVAAAKYGDAFKDARKRACRDQAGRLASGIRPTEEEVDSLPREKIAAAMVERVANAQPEAVFEENFKYIESAIVKPMLEDAYNQRAFQNGLARTLQVEGFAPGTIATNLLKRIEEGISSKRAEADDSGSVYGIFPSVASNTVPECAEDRAGAIVNRALDSQPVPLDNDAMALAIAQDIAAHRTFAESRKAFTPGLAAKMATSAIEAVSSSVPEAEREGFLAFARGYVKTREVESALGKRVKAALDADLKTLRDAFAAVQFENKFPSVAGGVWFPDEELVDRVAESNDFRKALSDWRAIPALAEFKDAEESMPMLEETSAMLDAGMVNRFEPGVSAMTMQHKIAESLLPKMKARFAGSGAALDDIVSQYTEEARGGWIAKMPDSAVAAGDAYKDLFPSARRKIEMLAKTILDAQAEMEKRPEDPEPEEPEPEEPPPPPEELEEIEMAFTVVYGRERDEIIAEISLDGSQTGRCTCPYPPNSYRRNCSAFAKSTADAIGDLVREAAKRNRVALKIAIAVKDPLVYYGAVSDASWLLKGITEELGEYVSSFELTEEQDRF